MRQVLTNKLFAASFICCVLGVILSFNVTAQTRRRPGVSKNNAAQKTSPSESMPRKIDAETAISLVYQVTSKNCANRDGSGSEGEDIVRLCKAYGDYLLRASGSEYRINYGIVSKKSPSGFSVMFFPLSGDAAAKYERADLYDQKLADEIEWRLDEQGKPYAVIVRAAFYKNTGSAKTFNNPKNKVAEVYFVRGLIGYEGLKADIPTVQTPYNPLEQARAVAAEFLDRNTPKN